MPVSCWLVTAARHSLAEKNLKFSRWSNMVSIKQNREASAVIECLETLQKWGFVKHAGNRWTYTAGEFHLPKESPFVLMHHLNWRTRAALDAQRPSSDSIHFTTVQTLSKKDITKLKELILQFVENCNGILQPSEPEEAIALACDFFPL
jgi:hypothetical protein